MLLSSHTVMWTIVEISVIIFRNTILFFPKLWEWLIRLKSDNPKDHKINLHQLEKLQYYVRHLFIYLFIYVLIGKWYVFRPLNTCHPVKNIVTNHKKNRGDQGPTQGCSADDDDDDDDDDRCTGVFEEFV